MNLLVPRRLCEAAGEYDCAVVAVRRGECGFSAFSTGRLAKLGALKSEGARALSAAAELALCVSLKLMRADFTPPAEYFYLPGGKPRMAAGRPEISIAHGGEYGVCAAAQAAVGMDLEGPPRASDALARRCLGAEEYDEYQKSPRPDMYFRDAWVAKESYVKLTGEGLGRRFSAIRATGNAVADARLWRAEFDGHALALCSRDALSPAFFVATAREAEAYVAEKL